MRGSNKGGGSFCSYAKINLDRNPSLSLALLSIPVVGAFVVSSLGFCLSQIRKMFHWLRAQLLAPVALGAQGRSERPRADRSSSGAIPLRSGVLKGLQS